jgi:hypothetical protein
MSNSSDLDQMLNGIPIKQSVTRLEKLLAGYCLSSLSNGKGHNTIAIVEASIRYCQEFINNRGLSADVIEIWVNELRHFSVYPRASFWQTQVTSG